MKYSTFPILFLLLGSLGFSKEKLNVLFIISDDLTYTALSCYGNKVCKTPNIDSLAERGTRFTQAYCQGTYCGPSRASFMSGYYPHATGVLGYKSPRPQIGDRVTWSQHFKNNGYLVHGQGKLYHPDLPPMYDSTLSWSSPDSDIFLNDDSWPGFQDGPLPTDCAETQPDDICGNIAWCAVNNATLE